MSFEPRTGIVREPKVISAGTLSVEYQWIRARNIKIKVPRKIIHLWLTKQCHIVVSVSVEHLGASRKNVQKNLFVNSQTLFFKNRQNTWASDRRTSSAEQWHVSHITVSKLYSCVQIENFLLLWLHTFADTKSCGYVCGMSMWRRLYLSLCCIRQPSNSVLTHIQQTSSLIMESRGASVLTGRFFFQSHII